MGVVNISSLPKSQGFKIDGVLQNQYMASSLTICDLDEDGEPDTVIGNALYGNNQGAVYVLWGQGSFNSLQFNTTDQILPPSAMTLSAQTSFQYLGASLACIDLDQDGHKELVIGAYSYTRAASDTPGAAYVIYFNGTRITNNINVETLSPSQGYLIRGTANADQFGFDMDNAGDVNHDGYDDLVISAPYAGGAGKVYVIYSKPGLNAFDANILSTDATRGFLLQGTTGSTFGYSVRGVHDFNNDGYADIAIGALRSNFAGINTGSTYVIFGNATRVTPTLVNGLNNMIRFDGNPSGQQPRLGASVGAAGRFDGDNYADIVINAPFESSPTGVRSVGSSFIVFGKSNYPNITNVNALGSDAIKIYGREAYAGLGYSTSGGGDLNGDGFDDVVTCEHYSFLRSDGERDGACYVLYGNTLQRNTRFNIDTLNDTQGYTLRAYSYGRLGHASLLFSNKTDIDKDGYPDILVSAPLASPNGISSAGILYAISGRLAPVITTSSGAINFTQANVPSIIDSGITVIDNNNPTLATATISISEGFVSNDTLGFVNQNGITGEYNAATGILTLTGVASVDHYQTALQSITYENSQVNFSNRTISFTASNGMKTSEAANRSVDLVPVDNLLNSSETASLLCLNEDDSQILFPQLGIIGGENLVLQKATVTIADATAEDSLIFANINSDAITSHYNNSTGTLMLTGPATASAFEAVLRTVQYANSNNATSSNEKNITVAVNFNGQSSNDITSKLNLITINDIPKVIHPIESFSVTADQAFSQVLSYPFDSPEDQLATSVVGAEGVSFNAANSTLRGLLTSVGLSRFSFLGTNACNQTGVNNFEVNVTSSPVTPTVSSTPRSSHHTGAIVGGVLGGLTLCIGGTLLGLWARKKHAEENSTADQDVEMETTAHNNPVYQKKRSWYSPIFRNKS